MAHAWVLFMLPQCCHKIIFFSCMKIPRSLESKSVMFVNQRFYTQQNEGAIAQLGERYAGSVEVRSVNDVVYSAFIKALLNFSKNVATNVATRKGIFEWEVQKKGWANFMLEFVNDFIEIMLSPKLLLQEWKLRSG